MSREDEDYRDNCEMTIGKMEGKTTSAADQPSVTIIQQVKYSHIHRKNYLIDNLTPCYLAMLMLYV